LSLLNSPVLFEKEGGLGYGRPLADSDLQLPSNERALVQRQKIVVPIPISVRSNKWSLASLTNHSNFGAFTIARINHEKSIRARFDARYDLLPRPLPPRVRVSEVGDVLVRALRMRLGNACHLYVCHFSFPFADSKTP
jgi:hypothetical protein